MAVTSGVGRQRLQCGRKFDGIRWLVDVLELHREDIASVVMVQELLNCDLRFIGNM